MIHYTTILKSFGIEESILLYTLKAHYLFGMLSFIFGPILNIFQQLYQLAFHYIFFFSFFRGGKRYDFQIERGGNPNLAWIGAMNLKILLCFFTQIYQLRYPKREWNICLFIL